MDERAQAIDHYPYGFSLRHCLDYLLTRPMVYAGFLYLAAMAGFLHRHDNGQITRVETWIVVWVMILLWPVFVAEAFLRFFLRKGQTSFWRRIVYLLVNILFPPIRIGAGSYIDKHLIWLPHIGWHPVNKDLRKRLERAFSIPMIFIALMVVPILVLDYLWEEQTNKNFYLGLTLDIGNAIIWTAFALELIIMLSVAAKKFKYCIRNWIDVAVVLVPLIDFLPNFIALLRTARLSRLFQIKKLTRLGRLYRLRGLVMRAWRGVLVLEVLQRIFNSSPEKRLAQLEELFQAKEEELGELRIEINELKQKILEKQDAEALVGKDQHPTLTRSVSEGE